MGVVAEIPVGKRETEEPQTPAELQDILCFLNYFKNTPQPDLGLGILGGTGQRTKVVQQPYIQS